MTLHQFLGILAARKWVLLATILASLAIALAVSLFFPPRYTAVASVVVDVKGSDPISGLLLPSQVMPGYLGTQTDIIQSSNVALKVVNALQLDQSPQVREQYLSDTDGKGSIQQWLAELLLKKLDVKPSRESSVLSISFTGSDPKFAALVANAFAKAYIETSLELRVEPARQVATWFDARTKALRDELETSQGRLSAYQSEKGIVAADERLDTENNRLEQLGLQLSQAQAQTFDTRTRHRLAREFLASGGNIGLLPDVLANPLVQSLKSDLSRQEGKLQELSSQLGTNHPGYQAAVAEVDQIRKRLLEEMRGAASALENAFQLAQRREADMRGAVAAQKAKVLSVKKERDELAVLLRETESAQKTFDITQQRFAQTSLESQANQTNIAVLSAALEPLEPSFPRLTLNLLLAAVLGTILGVALAVFAEARDRRVRAIEDLGDVGVPILGQMKRAAYPRRPRLIAGTARALPSA